MENLNKHITDLTDIHTNLEIQEKAEQSLFNTLHDKLEAETITEAEYKEMDDLENSSVRDLKKEVAELIEKAKEWAKPLALAIH